MNEELLIESAAARADYYSRTEVLEKVGTLALLPDGLHASREQVAAFYGVNAETALKHIVRRHREELEGNGLHTIEGKDAIRGATCTTKELGRGRPRMMLFPKRAILNVGMLLRDSEVAKQVRRYLLDVEAGASDIQRVEASQAQATTALDAENLAAVLGPLVARQVTAETEAIVARQFSPRMESATGTERRQGSEPLGNFRNAIAEHFGFRSINAVFPFLADKGAIREERVSPRIVKRFVLPEWSGVLEDGTQINKEGVALTGTVRVRAGKQTEFMNRVRSL
ncbi:hypothetical protein [Streptomyces sp. NPDC007063]|uniref:hypothetical protein n=1 Tax=Streptomyces sp. NPDC007063 TaxID=3364772 RepID=UPI0036A5E4C2